MRYPVKKQLMLCTERRAVLRMSVLVRFAIVQMPDGRKENEK